MDINYWECKYSECDEYYDGQEEFKHYKCNSEKGCGTCLLDNKWGDSVSFCEIAELDN